MNRTRGILSATVIATMLAVAGCGSDSGSSTTTSANTSAAPGSSAASSSGGGGGLEQALSEAYKGTIETPPATAPTPEAGKNIWVITFSAQFQDLSAPGQIIDAGSHMGWNVTVVDGKFDPNTMVNGLRQAVAAGADGIVLAYADCTLVKAGLQDAVNANIPVVAVEANDCDEQVTADGTISDTGQPGLFTAVPLYNTGSGEPVSFAQFYKEVYGPFQAVGLAAGTGESGKIIVLNETDVPVAFGAIAKMKETLASTCPSCEIVDTIDFVGTDLGAPLQQKISQSLVQHPDANGIYGLYDAATLDVATAVVTSGRSNDIFVMGGEGTAPIVEMVRADRGVDAGVGYSVSWESWAALDALNRLFNGEKPQGGGFPSGMGAQLFDRDHNLPAEGERFSGPIDFEAAYLKAWGVDGD